MPDGGPSKPEPRERARFTSRAAVLVVVVCAIALSLAYPVRDDIPVLLVEEARRPGEPT